MAKKPKSVRLAQAHHKIRKTAYPPKIHPLREQVAEMIPEALFCDGFDDAIIGIAERFGVPGVTAYDYEKVIAMLMKDGMDYEEAVEYFDFNIVGAWVGDDTPVFVRLLPGPKPKR